MNPARQYLLFASDQPFDGSGNCFKVIKWKRIEVDYRGLRFQDFLYARKVTLNNCKLSVEIILASGLQLQVIFRAN